MAHILDPGQIAEDDIPRRAAVVKSPEAIMDILGAVDAQKHSHPIVTQISESLGGQQGAIGCHREIEILAPLLKCSGIPSFLTGLTIA
jgi:hypothetical protein